MGCGGCLLTNIRLARTRFHARSRTRTRARAPSVHVIDTTMPRGKPRLLIPRRSGVEAFVDHGGDEFFVIEREDGGMQVRQALDFLLFHLRAGLG